MDHYSCKVQELLGDGASWSTVVEEGEPVDAAGSGATTLAIRVIASGAGRSTRGGDYVIHQIVVETKCPNQFLKVVHMVLKKEGLVRVLN
nr:hypothetical protein [Tanacetum cinerariifolium]